MHNNIDLKKHWNNVYSSKNVDELGWYEEFPEQSLNLINNCNLNLDDKIIDVGCGASLLIENLINKGHNNIIAVDLSEIALNKLKRRLDEKQSSKVNWVVEDISNPKSNLNIKNVSLWHDRAVLHFLIEKKDRQTYKNVLTKIVKINGYIIIAGFSIQGSKNCSGLEVYLYSEQTLSDFLGDSFTLVEHFDYLYKMPSEDTRPYIYTLFKRVS